MPLATEGDCVLTCRYRLASISARLTSQSVRFRCRRSTKTSSRRSLSESPRESAQMGRFVRQHLARIFGAAIESGHM